jgi:hypothetical protein
VGDIGNSRTRTAFMFRVVTLIGVAWMQAGAWAVREVMASGAPGSRSALGSKSIAYVSSALLTLLLVFQLVLRPGVRFY